MGLSPTYYLRSMPDEIDHCEDIAHLLKKVAHVETVLYKRPYLRLEAVQHCNR